VSHSQHRRRVTTLLALAAAGLFTLSACEGGAIGENTPASNGQNFVSGDSGTTVFGPGTGPAVPSVTGPAIGGGELSLSRLHGHVVVMNFWGSWCTPCRAEAPVLSSLARHFQPEGVRFLGVDVRDSPASAEAFMRDHHIGYPSLNDPAGEVALDFRGTVTPAGIPTTLVIGRDGRITARVVGEVSYPGLRGLIGKAVART
jgi:thiol-disulfide isomerase/thioredoxin